MTSATRLAILLGILAALGSVGVVSATAQNQPNAGRSIDLNGKGCRAVTNIYNTVPTETLRPLVPSTFTLFPSPVTKTPIVYLHSVMCETFGVGTEPGKQGGFALSAISIQPSDITPAAPRALYVIYAVTNLNALHEAFRAAGIDSHESADFKLTFPSSTQTVLNVGGGTSPFTLTIDGDKPTVPQPVGKYSFNFVAFNQKGQTVFHLDHLESQPGYRGKGTFTGKEGTLIYKILSGPPTFTALSIPMDFKGSITLSSR